VEFFGGGGAWWQAMPPAWLGSLLNGPVRLIGKCSLPQTTGTFEARKTPKTETETARGAV